MKPFIISIWILVFAFGAQANDGVFYGSGNHLIPIVESRISIKKEILSIKKEGDYFVVNVYYEMFNPDAAKSVEVGFEAPCPSGDYWSAINSNGHPFISNFTVNLNSENLQYDVATVSDSVYYVNGIYKELSKDKKQMIDDGEDFYDYFFVYHFKAHFKTGLNTIVHTYKIKASSSVADLYSFSYILTAAMRWGNKQIDDFTLLIDVGSFQHITLNRTFFKDVKDWHILGKGKAVNSNELDYDDSKLSDFYIQQGTLVYEKLNFKTNKELSFKAKNELFDFQTDTFNYKNHQLSFSEQLIFNYAVDEQSLKILRNLPYAKRGYVFKTKELQDYFSKMPWYSPDPSYLATLSELTDEEQKWLKQLKL